MELLRAIGTGRIPPNGIDAALSASAATIDTARTAARTAAAHMGQYWASHAADTAADQAHAAIERARIVADNSEHLAANLQAAAADVEHAMNRLAAILEHFVAEVGPWVPTLLTVPTGLVALLESAAEHLRQALIVVDQARTTLADRKRELEAIMGERIHDDPPPEQQNGTSPTPTATAPAAPSSSAPITPEITTATPPPPTPGPVDTDSAGGAILPGDGLTPEQYAGRPLYPSGPTPDPTGQPGVTGPIPPPGKHAPTAPAPTTTPTPPGPSGSTTTIPTSPPAPTGPTPPPTSPSPSRLPDQPGVIGSGAEVPNPPARLPDQPGVIGPPPES